MILIHSTHEAGVRVGSVGAALDGLLSAPNYLAEIDRSIVVGPLNTQDGAEMARLFAPHNKLEVFYFAHQGHINCPPALADLLNGIERAFNVRLLYGQRAFGDAAHEIVLVDASDSNTERLTRFKYYIWQTIGLDCTKYDHEPAFTQPVAIAEPAMAAVKEILEIRDWRLEITPTQSLISNLQSPPIILCHDTLCLPLCYAAQTNFPGQYTSVFVAHEVATVRALIESHDGHDTRFYNVMRSVSKQGKFLEDAFGDQSANFRHALLKTAERCDAVLAVSDLVVEELRFISPGLKNKRIEMVYTGVLNAPISIAEVQAASAKLRQYAWILTENMPNFVFSHVASMHVSKGLWRDIRVMEQLDKQLAERDESAVLFIVSSVAPQGRSSAEAQHMSEAYGWPAHHRAGWPDLVELEASLHLAITKFNAGARASKIILINQVGFSKERIGASFPPDLTFEDLRTGTDLEFGQSIYEPSGAEQMALLSSGALCVVSDACGCVGFVRQAIGMVRLMLPIAERQAPVANLIMGEYARLNYHDVDPMTIGQALRDDVERNTAQTLANLIMEHLPRTGSAKHKLMMQGYALAQRMSWDVVVQEQLLPALRVAHTT